MLAVLLGVAQRGERVGGLARLRHEDRKIALAQRRFAVAEFGGDIDLDRQPRKALEPVFGDEAGIIGRAAGRDRNALEFGLKSNGSLPGSTTRSFAMSR